MILPLVGRRIPIIADEYSDPEKGSGAVKITPAHDFNDFEVGKRHALPMINVLSPEGELLLQGNPDFTQGVDPSAELEQTIRELHGLDRFVARKKIVERLEEGGLVEKIEPYVYTVPHGDRSNVVIEPFLTDQWYVDAKTLAKPAIDAVKRGRTVFVPKNWENTYFHWMENIQPWCISRQLWWGHQIPAWYGPDAEIFVAEDEAQAAALAKKHYGKGVALTRDEDVLDTWFSSALWPFSTLGWPDETPEVKRYYPTDVLVTGFDIIFFWVARMMMMGLHVMEEVPFRDVYIHALVRDEKGQKMSKSKGNVIDPLELIDAYGADALRFTLSAMAAQGRDIKLSPSRVEGYRNFATKLWNAARFAEINACLPVERLRSGLGHADHQPLDRRRERARACRRHRGARSLSLQRGRRRHLLLHLAQVLRLVSRADQADPLGRRSTSCRRDARHDRLGARPRAQAAPSLHALRHRGAMGEAGFAEGEARETLLILAPWPKHLGLENADADAEIGWVIRLISEVRSVRSEMNVPAGAKVPLVVSGASEATTARAKRHEETILRLARIDAMSFGKAPSGAVQIVLDEATLALPLAGIIDVAAEFETAQARN